MAQHWKPTSGGEIQSGNPGLELVNFQSNHPFYYWLGIEAKSFMEEEMAGLPHPNAVAGKWEVQLVLVDAHLLAEDPAKAAALEDHLPAQDQLDYLLFVCPYWAHVLLGQFSQTDLSVHTHRQLPSGDFAADLRVKM